MKFTKLRCLVLMAVLALALAGVACNAIPTIKRNLDGAKNGWYKVQEDVSGYVDSGRLTAQDSAVFNAIDIKFRAAHHAAVVALEDVETLKNTAAENRLYAALAKIPEIIGEAYNFYIAMKLPIPQDLSALAAKKNLLE